MKIPDNYRRLSSYLIFLTLVCFQLPTGLFAGNDSAKSLAADSSENSYVTGASEGSGTVLDYATLKYNSSGTQQWKARYNGPASGNDTANAAVVDGSGNVYVTGSSLGSGSGLDYATIKYNSSGTQQWVARYNGPGNSDDIAYSDAVDGSGNVYVTGSSLGSGGTVLDYATIKYNSSGSEQWVSRYNGTGGGNDTASKVVADSSGNVYVTGNSLSSGGTVLDYATIKYNSSGSEQWVSSYNGTGNGNDKALALAVDSSGNVYVTGSSLGSGGTVLDYATIKYNSSGSEQWVSRYDGPASGNDKSTAIALGSSGTVYVTGSSLGSGTSLDYATIKYNSSGTQQWVARYNGTGNGDDTAVGISVNTMSGNVYVTGTSLGSGTSSDYATVKYNSSGTQQWATRFDGP